MIPTEQIQETQGRPENHQKEQRTIPGYLLVNMNLTDSSWWLVKNTPDVTRFVGASNKPVPLNQGEVDRPCRPRDRRASAHARAVLDRGVGQGRVRAAVRLLGRVSEINDDAAKLKVLVSIFSRETPVEVGSAAEEDLGPWASRKVLGPSSSSRCRVAPPDPELRRSAPPWASAA